MLGLSNGIPSWVATTTLSTISGTLSVSKGGTGITSAADGALLFGGVGGGSANLTALATTSGAGRFLSLDYTTGRPSWIATTSLGIAISDTTGTLTAARGGTGFASYTPGDILYADSATSFAKVASTTNGFVLTLSDGKPTWVATSSINNGVSSIQQTGGGSAQTGAITFATSSFQERSRLLAGELAQAHSRAVSFFTEQEQALFSQSPPPHQPSLPPSRTPAPSVPSSEVQQERSLLQRTVSHSPILRRLQQTQSS
ncbi:MAG: hypothetical protein ABA06_00010 [Parcubacteria bacterium C7867-001]|nr:MAG: hypothetical protein ABA06_00010 [Parcubacteria bacterium C7867-001]